MDDEGPGGLDVAVNNKNTVLYWLRGDDVDDDTIPTRPFVETFSINLGRNRETAGLSPVSKTWLPEAWIYAKATGLVAVTLKPQRP
jgi:hypothetical protein